MWAESEAGPSRCDSRRKGYCGYCRVLYSNLDQHLSTLRHRDLVRTSSAGNRTKRTLLERFLQDVIKHHPHHYKDPRPSHADLPSCSAPLAPRPQVEVGRVSSVSVGVGLSDDHLTNSDPDQHGDLHSHSQSREGAGQGLSAPVFGQEDRSSAPLILTTPFHSQAPPPAHKKAHRKSNRRKTGQTSSDHPQPGSSTHQDQELGLLQGSGPGPRDFPGLSSGLSSGPGPGACPGPGPGACPGPGAVPGLSSGPGPLVVWPWLAWQKEREAVFPLDQVDPVDQVVIQTCCHGDDQEETDSFNLSIPVSMETSSQDWDSPAQGAGPVSHQVDLSGLRDSQVDLQDQVYSAQLDSALKRKGAGLQRVGLPDSLQGKTWEEMEREDEERIQTLVQQFRTQNFICYFDSESLARYGRRSHSKKKCANANGTKPDSGVVPLLDREEDDWVPARRRRDRKWRFRVASRCQVVKVSHGTQTVPLVIPRPVAEALPTTAPRTNQEWASCGGPAPLPWLRLPPPYASIVSPVQPRTSLVYLLTPPSGPAPSRIPVSDPVLRRCRRKRRPLEAAAALTVRYKRLPLRLYQPRTNRILRTARRGSTPSGSLVRQLFRSLNPDLNRPPELRSTLSMDPTLRGRSQPEATPLLQTTHPQHSRGRGRAKATPPPVKNEGPRRTGRGRGKRGGS